MKCLAYLKWLLVLFLLSVGILFLLNGLGVNVPFIKFREFESYQLPAGAFLTICGVSMAIFWKVKISKTEITEETEVKDGGYIKRIKKMVYTAVTFINNLK